MTSDKYKLSRARNVTIGFEEQAGKNEEKEWVKSERQEGALRAGKRIEKGGVMQTFNGQKKIGGLHIN